MSGTEALAQPGTGNFSRVLRLLEAAATGPGPLDDQLARAEGALAELQDAAAAAAGDLTLAKAQAAEARTAAAATAWEMSQADSVPATVRTTSTTTPTTTLPAPKVTGPPTLTTLAEQPTRVVAANSAPAPAPVPDRKADLAAQLRRDALVVESATARVAAGEALVAAKAAEVAGAERTVEDLRRQVWSRLNDPTFAKAARVLVAAGDGQQVAPSTLARADVPPPALELYRQAAATCPGLSWTVLAAIGSVESDHGRSTASGVRSGANFAGAMGPMQFLAGTWAIYGADGNGDGVRDVYDPADAVAGAARYLCASGAGTLPGLAAALWAYNHAGWYVDQVLVLALRYGSDGLAIVPATPDVAGLLGRPNLVLTDQARNDLAAGIVDARVVRMLAAASADHRIAVSVIETGHSQFVAGTDRVSNHYAGRAVDIYAVDGAAVTAGNDAALELALAVMTTAPDLRPTEFGSPWPEFGAFPGAFSDTDHLDHLHLGWSPKTT